MHLQWHTVSSDPRFRFVYHQGEQAGPLIVAVHGSDRDVSELVSGLRPVANSSGASIIAPLFHTSDGIPLSADGYKFLNAGGIDYRSLLIQMVRQAAPDHGQVYLFGFSGGAQFVHRFAYFSPIPLSGVIAVAPGNVTLIRDDLDWWPGLRGSAAALEAAPDIAALRSTPMRIAVGDQDRFGGLITRPQGSPFGAEHSDLAGQTRTARAQALAESLRSAGISAEYHPIAGAGHSLSAATEFGSAHLGDWITGEA